MLVSQDVITQEVYSYIKRQKEVSSKEVELRFPTKKRRKQARVALQNLLRTGKIKINGNLRIELM